MIEINRVNIDGLIQELKELNSINDKELAHKRADEILCEILLSLCGLPEIVEAWEKVDKWYA